MRKIKMRKEMDKGEKKIEMQGQIKLSTDLVIKFLEQAVIFNKSNKKL